MEGLIALAVIAVVIRVVIFFAYSELDNALGWHGSDDATDDYCQRRTYNEPLYHTTVGGWSSGGSIVNNSTNNYGIPIDD